MPSPKINLQKLSASTATLIVLGLAAGCSSSQPPQTLPSSSASATPQAAEPVTLPSLGASPLPYFNLIVRAENKAASAKSIAQSAQSQDDWNLAIQQWRQAIALLQGVPKSSPKKALAQQKVAEYQRHIAAAKQRVVNASKATPTKISAAPNSAPSRLTPSNHSTAIKVVATRPNKPSVASPPVSGKAALAKHLKQIGAKMYATYWCGVCRRQEQLFGSEAFSQINRIECDPRGKNAQYFLCNQAKIRAFPTWEIKGKFYEGGLPLEVLAQLSGYRGSSDFSK